MDKRYKKGDFVNDYSIIKMIGEGRYGIAYLAVNDKNEKVVVKQLKKNMIDKTKDKIFYEEQILSNLKYSCFPKFIANFADNDKVGYILEYVEGDVFETIIRKGKYKFTRNIIYDICKKLLDLVEILHKNNIVHRDVRLPNVILKENNELALIDFGLARFIDEKNREQIDYWYIGDFLVHLYYSSYEEDSNEENDEEEPWYEELDLNHDEKIFLKRLMNIDGSYKNIEEIRLQLNKLKNYNK